MRMRLIRWFLTFLLVFAASILALLMLALLLIAIGVLQFARLARWIRPVAQPGADAAVGGRVDRAVDADLPEAPPNVPLHHVRSWDSTRSRAIDRWYYKDARGQWVFVRAPRTA